MNERPVSFTLEELWLLNDLVRHEISEAERWKFPPTSKPLCDEIVFAIVACEDNDLPEYSLLLSDGDLMVIDYNVRRDAKHPDGAFGKQILLKTFRARTELAFGYEADAAHDKSYKEEVNANASA
jgi:hypothetical protein